MKREPDRQRQGQIKKVTQMICDIRETNQNKQMPLNKSGNIQQDIITTTKKQYTHKYTLTHTHTKQSENIHNDTQL